MLIKPLFITGYEWVIVIIIIAVILFVGPSKIPKLARSIGQAKKEFEAAKQEITSPSPPTSAPQPTVDVDPLVETAIKLGIDVKGKTKAQISDEIVARTKGKAES